MKLTVFGAFILFANAYGGKKRILQTAENNESSIYAVHQWVTSENIGVLERKVDTIVKNNVEEYTKLFNFYHIISVIINSISHVSNSSCLQDLVYLKENIDFKNIPNSWALKMLDSFGKPESGMLEGNVKWIGDFDECRRVYAPKKNGSGGFHGKYCSLQVNVTYLQLTTIGLCLPESCNPSIFLNGINISNSLVESDFNVEIHSISCKSNYVKLSVAGIITLSIMSVFFFLVFMGSFKTALKYFTASEIPLHTLQKNGHIETPTINSRKLSNRVSQESILIDEDPSKLKDTQFSEKCDSFLNCFCIITNGSKLLNTDDTEGQLLCIHGIRFLSMTWVILCHVYASPIDTARSVEMAVPLLDNFLFQVVVNGWYAVDSFFVLSGFLLAYLYFQECAKKEGAAIPWIYFYVHRYLRLTPVYLIVLAFYATVVPVMGSGPFWSDSNIDVNCHENWWWNLLYINNFQSNVVMCMDWSWYLANDMQFFAISPLFLVTLWRWPKIGYVLLATFLCSSWILGFWITYEYDLMAGAVGILPNIQKDPTFMIRWMDYNDKIYVKPYTRIAPYVIGIALGYILFQRKTTNAKANPSTLWIGWLIAAPAGLYCVYGVYHQASSLVGDSIFNALSRTVYGLSLSWLLFVCLSGQGGFVDKILSWKLFIPLSRLTYCAYLIHPFLINLYVFTMKTTLDVSHPTMILLHLGLVSVTYFFAMLVSLIFESPLIRVEKLTTSLRKSRS